MLPKGAKPLTNPMGTAPGIMTLARGTTVVSFPGVPTEMKAIFKTSVVPLLQRSGGVAPIETYVMMVGIIESALASILEDARVNYPTLYWKSHPIGRETGVRSLIKLHVYTVRAGDKNTVRNAIAYFLERLSSFADTSTR